MSSISSTSGSNSDVADQYATQQAEKDRLRSEHEAEMDRLKQNYALEKESTRDRFENSVQAERMRSYDNLRNTKKQFSKEEKTLKNAGDEHIHQKSDEYKQQEMTITKEGTARVDEAKKKQAAAEEYQRNQALSANTVSRTNYGRDAQAIINDTDHKIEALQEDKKATLERRRAEHAVAVDQIKAHYDQRQNQVLNQHEQETQRIEEGTQQQINASLVANAQRLDQHQQKENNPFYQLNRMDSSFSDEGDHYTLRVNLPEYERKGFRVQIAGHELQLSGIRNAHNKVDLEPGHGVSTNSYQTFSERYQFDSPVDAKAMTSVQDGEWVEYTIPKFGANHRLGEQTAREIRKEDLSMAKELDFKDTLPLPTVITDKGSETIS